MYLKKLELIGFKSFAERTVLNFEPGMTAVVGPNGCGKSNIADAVRWVLGEQSAKALRGGKMQDVIFNGADSMKAMSMAEVSLTLADCEEVLKTDFNEMTITRRVFRNGDSGYFKNKQACRLKDIQRLFMDTGVGRGSYSILEQGKIDQILSSRPEDRRTVFEEASGITKYKADRKEALRKLDHTQQNLDRLDDVIREVKRRMISLQRQAGKAKRFRELQDRLRDRDLWVTRHNLASMQEAIGDLEVKVDEATKTLTSSREAIHKEEEQVEGARAELEQTDKVIADVMEKAVGLRNNLNNAQHSIKVNTERIQEMEAYASRDARDAEEARARLDQHKQGLKELETRLTGTREHREQAQQVLEQHRKQLQTLEEDSKARRAETQQLRSQSHALEQQHGKFQQHLRDYDERERGRMVRQERLNAEHAELELNVEKRGARTAELTTVVEELQTKEAEQTKTLQQMQEQQVEQGTRIRERRTEWNEYQQKAAALIARVDVLKAQAADKEDFAGGARLLLSDDDVAGLDRSRVLGALAEQLSTERKAQRALESILRIWIDAVVVSDRASLKSVLDALDTADAGAARLLTLEGGSAVILKDGPGESLLELVKCASDFRPLAERLLGGVRLVDSIADAGQPRENETFVDGSGNILRGDGSAERYAEEAGAGNPLQLQADISAAETELGEIQSKANQLKELIDASQSEETELQQNLKQRRETLQAVHRDLASQQGEFRSQQRDLEQATERLGKVKKQLAELKEKHGAKDEERMKLVEGVERTRKEQDAIRAVIEEKVASFDQLEAQRNKASQQVTEHRIRFAEHQQQAELQERQLQNMVDRIKEFETTIHERTTGASTHQDRVGALKTEIEKAKTQIQPLEESLEKENAKLGSIRDERRAKLEKVQAADRDLREKRSSVERLQEGHGRMEVDVAQRRVRYENAIQRVTEAYNITLPEVHGAEEPEWENGEAPEWSVLEGEVSAMKDKLESMGPVNLVAIEEFQEQEDRYQFLMEQQKDLVEAKDQFLEMIKKINVTSMEMFTTTFNAVNENFQKMFKQLFGGGEARLELMESDSDDLLDAGIDIIAKPPGKKPQTISLLSGGERTMTAVALLFSLYQVKPSPFCLLDELDAALDDANIGRFIAMVQSFLEDSQFVVITHNQKTIAAADVLYGVTQQRKGISKIVSVKLTDHDKDEAETRKAKELAEAK